MKRTLLTAVSAAAVSLSLAAGIPAFSQEAQLAASVSSGMAELGMDTEMVGALTESQLAEIENVLNVDESVDDKRHRIEQIIGANPGDETAPGPSAQGQLAASVSSGMAQLGLDTEIVGALSEAQLAEIENVLNVDDSVDNKRHRIEEITGANAATGTAPGPTAEGQLAASVSSGMAELGLDTEVVPTLSEAQLAEIENVLNVDDSVDNKRHRIEVILAE